MKDLIKRTYIFFLIIYFLIVSLNFISSTQTYLNENIQWESNLTHVEYSAIAFGDINNDNKIDLVINGKSEITGGSIYKTNIYINDGSSLTENSIWQQNLTNAGMGSLALGDIDNDGDLDLALSGCISGGDFVDACDNGAIKTFIYINNGTSFVESIQWEQNLTAVYRSSLTFGDINHDGKLDLILSGETENSIISKIYINNGTNLVENSQWQNNLTGIRESSLALGDIDNDGNLDLVISGRDNQFNKLTKVYINNGSTFTESQQWQNNLIGVQDSSLALADFDNNGYLDLSLTGCCDKHRIYRNNDSTFVEIDREITGGLTGVFAGSQAFGDYDNDGYLDLITGGREQYTTLYLYNSTSANFTINTNDPETHILNMDYSSFAWIDIDNDLDLDLIGTGYGTEGGGLGNSTTKAFVYLNNRSLTKNNTLPSPPTTFSSDYNNTNEVLNLTWESGSDAETPTLGLYYNLRVGNSTNENSIVIGVYGGSSNPTAGYFGNMMQRKSILLNVNLSNGTYYWYVQTIDTGLAKSAWGVRQIFTVGTIADVTAPTISGVGSSSITSSTATITWTTNEASNSTVDYGTTTALGSEINSANFVGGHSIGLTGLSASTLYYYKVTSCDSSNNCKTSSQYSFTTSASGGGNNNPGGNSPGGNTTTQISFWTQTYPVSEEEFINGFSKELSTKNRLQVSVNNETHYVGINELTNSTATVNISSEPQIAILSIGDIRRFEVTGDNYYDLNATLNSINLTSNKANITIISVHDEITSQTIAEEQTKEQTAQEKKKEDIKAERIFWYYFVVGIIIIFIIAVIIFLIKHMKKEKEK